jgi:hypothetical protein
MIGGIALQDLAIMFIDEKVRIDDDQWLQDARAPVYEQPDLPRLLDRIAVSCPVCTGLGFGPGMGLLRCPVLDLACNLCNMCHLVSASAACKPCMHGLPFQLCHHLRTR